MRSEHGYGWFALVAIAVGCNAMVVEPPPPSEDPTPDGGVTNAPDSGTERDAEASYEGDASSGIEPDATIATDSAMPTETTTSEHLLWLFDGETGVLGDRLAPHDGGRASVCNHHPEEALRFVASDDAYAGDFLARFHMESEWSWGRGFGCQAKIRSRLRSPEGIDLHEGEGYWLGFAVRLPEDWAMPARNYTVMSIHPAPGDGPAVYLIYDADLRRRINFKPDLGPRNHYFGEVTPGTWDAYVVHLVMAHDDRGHFRLWHRHEGDAEWTEELDYSGPTMRPEMEYPAMPQLGLIAGGEVWDDPQPSRTAHFDEIRLGTDETGFDVVAPGSGVVLP
jgi:hypothetical protein